MTQRITLAGVVALMLAALGVWMLSGDNDQPAASQNVEPAPVSDNSLNNALSEQQLAREAEQVPEVSAETPLFSADLLEPAVAVAVESTLEVVLEVERDTGLYPQQNSTEKPVAPVEPTETTEVVEPQITAPDTLPSDSLNSNSLNPDTLQPEKSEAPAEENATPEQPATRMAGIDVEQEGLEPKEEEKKLGLYWQSKDKRFAVNPWLRFQFRYSNPFDSDPHNLSDFDDLPGSELEVHRARLKVEGYLFDPAYAIYLEQSLVEDYQLLDLRLDFELPRNIFVRFGQYKALYNRERVDSSGAQEFAERSVSNYAFTVDRQRGLTLSKHFFAGTHFDNWLMLGVFQGDGRGRPEQKGSDPMLMARWQWQFLAQPVPFSQTDFKFTQKPAASLAFAYAQVTGPYTRFSSSGGGQLDGFSGGGDDRYSLNQWLQEFAWKYQGYSLQQEFHIKDIEDHEGNDDGRLQGGYVQAGKAWQSKWIDFPVELAVRYGRVEWDITQPRTQQELSAALNLFFNGHNSKLTLDASRIKIDMQGTSDSDNRIRLQWDISF